MQWRNAAAQITYALHVFLLFSPRLCSLSNLNSLLFWCLSIIFGSMDSETCGLLHMGVCMEDHSQHAFTLEPSVFSPLVQMPRPPINSNPITGTTWIIMFSMSKNSRSHVTRAGGRAWSGCSLLEEGCSQ